MGPSLVLAFEPGDGTGRRDLAWVRRHDPARAWLRGRRYLRVKRLLDLVLVVAGLPLWGPLLGLAWLTVKLHEPGQPAFFVQTRTGRHGRRFKMIKFRTMVADAERMKAALAASNELGWPDFKIARDPRVTAPGRFLRRTRLDELPQLVNVLRGEMALVGPRPTSMAPDTYQLWQTQRFEVPPGITCLWQLQQSRYRTFDQRMRLDILYVEHRGLGLDLEILLRTLVHTVIARDGC